MKILIVGAAGLVGSNIACRLAGMRDKHSVVCIDDLSFGSLKNLNCGVEFLMTPFQYLTEEYLKPFDVMVYSACVNIIAAMDDPRYTFKVNATDTLELFKKFKGKIVNLGTSSVYGDAQTLPTPETAEINCLEVYSDSKRVAELELQRRRKYTTLRLSNVYGKNQRPDHPYSGVMCRLIRDIAEGTPIRIYGDGKQSRDFTFVDDVVEAVIRCIKMPALNTEINIASGIETTIQQAVSAIENVVQCVEGAEYMPKRKIDTISRRWLDISKAKKLLFWEPTVMLKEGIERTLEWMKDERIVL